MICHSHLKIGISSLLIGLVVGLFGPVTPAIAEEVPVIGKNEILANGTGLIKEGNIAAAKNMAISKALRKGLELYLSQNLGSQTMVTHYHNLINEVVPKAREIVENFNILAEEQADQEYSVLVRIKINNEIMTEKLREIGIVESEGRALKVLFLVSQLDSNQGKVSYWWGDPEGGGNLTPVELSLLNNFAKQGFQTINRLNQFPEGSYSPEMKSLDLDEKDAFEWGRLFGADLVILGRCELIDSKDVIMDLSTLDVKGEAVTDRMRTIETIKQEDENPEDIFTALDRVTRKIASRAYASTTEMGNTGFGFIESEVALRGLTHFRQLRAFQSFLSTALKGTKSVRQSRLNHRSIVLLVRFEGDEETLLQELQTNDNIPFEADVFKTNEGLIVVQIR